MEGCAAMIFPWEITEVVSVRQPMSYTIVKYNYEVLQFFIKTQIPAETESNDLLEQLEQHHVVRCQGCDWERVLTLLKLLEEEMGLESVTVAKSAAPYTVETLAQTFFISQSTVRRYIQSMTGLTFHELLNSMRIAKTANYLLYTDLTLEELADLFGFVDTSHISKVFQARVGMKVNEYRKTYQNVQQLCRIHESKSDYTLVNYLVRNSAQDLKIQSVAAVHGVTPQELNRMLQYQVGRNFADFLNKIRIDNACALLLESDSSIADIALRVGYSNIKTFNRNFVNSKQMTPSAFRRNVGSRPIREPDGEQE